MISSFSDWRTITDEKEKYMAYLCSREWAEKKEAVRLRSRGKCERCKYHDMEACHHLTYARKYNERLEDLQSICSPCHQFIHGKSSRDPVLDIPVVAFGRTIRNVYLAGKITGTTWRDGIAPGWSRSCESGGLGGADTGEDWEIRPFACPLPSGRSLNLTGPFWWDLSGGHCSAMDYDARHASSRLEWHNDDDSRDFVWKNVKRAIGRSDLLFAWIDSTDCYGTLIEIGLAHGKCPVVIGIQEDKTSYESELWMAFESAADYWYGRSAEEAWRRFWK